MQKYREIKLFPWEVKKPRKSVPLVQPFQDQRTVMRNMLINYSPVKAANLVTRVKRYRRSTRSTLSTTITATKSRYNPSKSSNNVPNYLSPLPPPSRNPPFSHYLKHTKTLSQNLAQHSRKALSILKDCERIHSESQTLSKTRRSMKHELNTMAKRMQTTLNKDLISINLGTTEGMLAEILRKSQPKVNRRHIRQYFGLTTHK